jgi:hypothetical protein
VTARTRCADCRVDTLPAEWGDQAEYYMVHDELWAASGVAEHAFLCIGCLERRLRRRLRPEDFIDAAINDPAVRPTPRYAWSYRTRRLRDRLLGRGLPVHDPAQGRLFEVER